ncbi:hypothetical protein BJ085DRAFT_35011 [Dimargaris cristalligena]|uniref:Uncharacterized protein n=1 Tax=Dimargaris cristalligena TaxID=215637 RepID=A0A4Q0A235_9FUNG|nr:hypothetical protein BJ085DRAFT_35011 [Dimargaris cristalligena]|eukprot:RKP39372.1 hypothetical protein BJ085DRAFT_35011 [Dimargaris cristalligena]
MITTFHQGPNQHFSSSHGHHRHYPHHRHVHSHPHSHSHTRLDVGPSVPPIIASPNHSVPPSVPSPYTYPSSSYRLSTPHNIEPVYHHHRRHHHHPTTTTTTTTTTVATTSTTSLGYPNKLVLPSLRSPGSVIELPRPFPDHYIERTAIASPEWPRSTTPASYLNNHLSGPSPPTKRTKLSPTTTTITTTTTTPSSILVPARSRRKVTPLNLTEGISQLHQRLQALEVRFGFLRGHFQLPQLPPKFISLDLTPAAHPSSPAQVGKSPASSLLLLPPLSSTSSVLSGILPPLTQARTPRPTTAPTTTCGSIMSTAGGLDPRPIAAESRPEDLIRNLFELRDTNYRLSWYYIKNKCEVDYLEHQLRNAKSEYWQ